MQNSNENDLWLYRCWLIVNGGSGDDVDLVE